MQAAEYRTVLPVFFVTASVLSLTLFCGLGTIFVHPVMKSQIDSRGIVGRFGVMMVLAFFISVTVSGVRVSYWPYLTLLIGEMCMCGYVLKNSSGSK